MGFKFKHVFKGAKKLLPIAGAVAGGAFGGPLGASLGGALGGGLSSKNHRLDHALGGGLLGLGHGMLSPMLGQSLGLDPSSFLGKGMMMGSPSIGQQLGFGSIGGSAARGAAFSGLQNVGGGSSGGGGLLGGLFGGGAGGGGGSGGMLGGLGGLNGLLLAGALGGKLLGKSKMPKYGTPENESMQQAVHRNKHDWGDPSQYFPKINERNPIQYPPEGYRGLAWNFFPTPEEQAQQLKRATEEIAQYETNRFAKGGRVHGYYSGKNGGQSDKRAVKLKPDSFIIDATTLSLAGDGNTENGAHVVKNWAHSFAKGGFVRDSDYNRKVNAFVSDGELLLTPKEVSAIGGGNINKGEKRINKMRRGLRKHKGLTKFLPPKSKSLDKYAGIQR
jgi:hypothetical protein